MNCECYFHNIEYHLKSALDRSRSRVLVAVAWFTNADIAASLIGRPEVSIEIICDENSFNQRSEAITLCRNSGIEVTMIKDLTKSSYLMHHKFCVIDNHTLITGSYNWTKNANTNDENIMIIRDQQMAALYGQEFRLLKEMKNPRRSIVLNPEELKPIEKILHQRLFALFKDSFQRGKLIKGVLGGYEDVTICTRIRVLHESLINSMRAKAPTLMVYSRLIEKHGIFYRKRSTPEELLAEENRYRLYTVKNLDFDVSFTFRRMKIDVIHMIWCRYMKKFKEELSEEQEMRVFKMADFLMKEIKSLKEMQCSSVLGYASYF